MKNFAWGFACGLLITALIASAQDSLPIGSFTGEVWNKMDELGKTAYVAGYLDGQGTHRTWFEGCAAQSDTAKICLDKLEIRFPALKRGSLNQITQGLDKLSEDYRNQKVNLVGLIQVVSMELAGREASEVDDTLRGWRGTANK